ncbi:SRPBCC family protein [Paenibacillus sp.]|uniref:SRPBCC family protein n=1 Tax=Paenibacillus sp. TaxID=58172 RepID=UPI0028B0F764|nr:SRPBCC family protein [Paenibacillus sp.]
MSTQTSRVLIHASAKKVWDAITKPELVKQWQYGSDLLTDWQIGSEIRFHSEWDGNVYEQWGEVLGFEPYKLIKYTLFAPRPDLEDKPENYFIMSYTLIEEGNEILLIIEQNDNRPGTTHQESQGEEGQTILAVLKDVAESVF